MEAKHRFIESMGRHIEEEGAPRIAGRLLGALLLNPGACSLDDLTEQLQVSKGSVSSNARLLEQWGVAERVNVPGDRRDFYRIAEDAPVRVLEQRLSRIRALLEQLREGRDSAAQGDARIQERFDSIISFQERALGVLAEEIERQRNR